ncbi:MAG: polysaccharide deacetylase, partial [Sulfitobacter sp.]|nr:polysaccharide deacetylase [Sulfitobacter sp.]
MRIDWTDLREELAKWREEGLDLPLWWRDDDATHETVHLHRLLDLGAGFALPVHLAVIPKLADPGLADLCHDHPYVRVLVHGWAHENHAPHGRKKAEFGHPRSALAEEAAA